MNIQQMQYFAEVCRQENVTKAAASLHMSQSTLSQSMKNLEAETGLNLFRHVGRNIQLTADGQALFQEVEKMLKQVKRFEANVKEIAKRHNRLQLAVPSQIATIILPLLLGEFFQLILTGNGILQDSNLIAIPIAGLAQKGFIVTKKGRQIYADERCLIDFVRRKFADAPEHMNGTP